METVEQINALRKAVTVQGAVTSDFDLNPDVVLPADRKLRPAGVLCAFEQTPLGLEVILTKRSSRLKHHPGQIAFPGGKQDEGDRDVVDAALREAYEEIGLPKTHVEVIGTLPTHETVTGFLVTPVLGLVRESFEVLPEKGEVEEVFRAPFAHVTDPARYAVQSRRWRGHRRSYFTAPLGPYYIWGATARMLRVLADRVSE
ncbi:CoA pyrophosphatase [Pacificoceanicola onchidii]|uniref:CoA pyrophosphatase n=1 Tax=Pacificoceanicola onchidii TaxID=2562685 RepID=UPI0010A5F7C2|nr:CoA pyrophosphatase [Pacificoceanicola onchidii]